MFTNVILSSAAVFLVFNWTSLVPISNAPEITLPLMSDLLKVTCAQLELDARDVYLRGQLSGNFSSLKVKLTTATSVSFGPGPNQTTCQPMTSSLMTHQRSACNQTFCAVPTACSYTGNKAISTDPIYWEYDFICACSQSVCNELLLWLRPVQGQHNRVELCEVDVWSLWFVWQWHYPAHMLTPVNC